MKILIIVPTYNEASNIKKFCKLISLYCPQAELLFIDDSSPDGTLEEIEKQSNIIENVIHIVSRPKKLGLGSAYKKGFQFALEKNYKVIIQMDADLSHHPKYLPAMIKKLIDNDLVIGSRYVKGGSISGWNWSRRLLSYAGNFYARILLGNNIKEWTGGFNLWDYKALSSINWADLKSHGYAFQIEVKFYASKKQFEIYEYPIQFCDRMEGISKIEKSIIFEAFFKVLKLGFRFQTMNNF